MEFRRTLVYKNYVVFVGLLVLLVGGMLAWIVNARLEAFQQYHRNISQSSLNGVEKQVAFYIAEKRRMVELFVDDHIKQIRDLAADPNNDALHQSLGDIITHHFPNRFAFSITDTHGKPLFEDFDGLISQLCLGDIKQFSQGDQPYRPYIHPNPEGYHFDIMVRYGVDKNEGIFFVSFLANVLGDIVNSFQSPDHQIMLILPQKKDLIEVVAGGARIHWIRDDYRLSAQEQADIVLRHNIEGTRWQAADLQTPTWYASYRNKLIAESVSIFLLFVIVALLLVIRLRREERQREMAVEQKQALMGVISHEFRSPASVIKSALELIADGDAGEVSADVKKYIDMALCSTSHLLLLVDDFLDIQKIESGNLQIKKQKTQLSQLVANTVQRNKLYAEQFRACYELKAPLADDHVYCDEHRIEQVLTNILTNAVKYGSKQDTIEVEVTRQGERLRVSVSDHGPGIAKDFQPRVFEKFAMANEWNKDQKVKSTGLGLSIAKAIVEQHGGSIGFDTRTDACPEIGTTFWFELPVASAA